LSFTIAPIKKAKDRFQDNCMKMLHHRRMEKGKEKSNKENQKLPNRIEKVK
jgi:hypothetical protein